MNLEKNYSKFETQSHRNSSGLHPIGNMANKWTSYSKPQLGVQRPRQTISRTRTRHNKKRPKRLQTPRPRASGRTPRPRTSLKDAGVVVNPGKIKMNLRNTRPVVR